MRLDDSARATALTATNSTTVRFVDTNVLLYAISRDPEEQDEAGRPDPLTHEQATELVESFLRFPVLDITTDLMLAAAATFQRLGVSYSDAAILEAARSGVTSSSQRTSATARTTPECWSRTPFAFPDRRHRLSSGRRKLARPASTN